MLSAAAAFTTFRFSFWDAAKVAKFWSNVESASCSPRTAATAAAVSQAAKLFPIVLSAFNAARKSAPLSAFAH